MAPPGTNTDQRQASGADPVEAASVRVARQPILDARASLIGYELLYRSARRDSAGVVDDRQATSTVVLDGLLDVGVFDLVGESLAYLNVSRDFLLSMRPLPLPADRVVLELLEDQLVDAELLDVLGELRQAGFRIALDDFRMTPQAHELLAHAAIVKLDVLEHDGPGLERLVGELRSLPQAPSLLAEKVETREEFERCLGLGFDAFQGYFFARPALVERERLPSQGLAGLGALADLTAAEDFDELHRIITRDVGLSMRLLRYANSAALSLPRRVGSVQEGLTWLGASTVRRFALMVAMAGARDMPSELLVTALVRARMCQLLRGGRDDAEGESAFTVGLFSVADALANTPMPELVAQLPFRSDIAAALIEGSGELGELLGSVVAYQRGDFEGATGLASRTPEIERIYIDAVAWADRSSAEIAA